jgi:ribosome modulation factor
MDQKLRRDAPPEGSDAFRSGRQAFEAGRELTENPYAAGSIARSTWAGGWHRGKKATQRRNPEQAA